MMVPRGTSPTYEAFIRASGALSAKRRALMKMTKVQRAYSEVLLFRSCFTVSLEIYTRDTVTLAHKEIMNRYSDCTEAFSPALCQDEESGALGHKSINGSVKWSYYGHGGHLFVFFAGVLYSSQWCEQVAVWKRGTLRILRSAVVAWFYCNSRNKHANVSSATFFTGSPWNKTHINKY